MGECILLKVNIQSSRWARFRRSMILTVGISLMVATQSLAAPEPEVKAEKSSSLTITAADYHSVAYNSNGDVWYWGGIADVIDGKHIFRDNKPKLMEGLND